MTSLELKQWRHKNNYSQSQLAEALGVITMTVSRWERGETEISPFLDLGLKSRKEGDGIKVGRPAAKKDNEKGR